jgi:hypothetical protein
MPDMTGDLFADTAAEKPRGKTFAPETLSPPQIKRIHAWAEKTVPWVSRGAFDSFTTVDQYIEETLEWWDGAGKQRRKWVSVTQNRIRKVERARLTRLAQQGSEEAAMALRTPTEWATRYDRKARAVAIVGASSEGGELIRPAGGKVIQLKASEF